MVNNKSMALYTSLACFLLVALIVILYSQFFTAPNKVAEPALSEPTSLPAPTQSANQDVSTVAPSSPLSSVVPPPPKAVMPLLTPRQAQIAGLDLAKDPQTDELVREIEAMNQAIEQRLAAPTIEERQQADIAATAQAEAMALIQQVDAKHGFDSLAQADQQFEQTQIDDPELQQIISEGQQLEDEIATIAQGLQ